MTDVSCTKVHPLFRGDPPKVRLFHFDRAEFKFRNFAIGIHSGVGEDIGCGFHIGKGQKHHIFGHCAVCAAMTTMLPLLVVSRTCPPASTPSLRRVLGCSEQLASGSTASNTLARRVIDPVCQCSNCRPVVRIIG